MIYLPEGRRRNFSRAIRLPGRVLYRGMFIGRAMFCASLAICDMIEMAIQQEIVSRQMREMRCRGSRADSCISRLPLLRLMLQPARSMRSTTPFLFYAPWRRLWSTTPPMLWRRRSRQSFLPGMWCPSAYHAHRRQGAAARACGARRVRLPLREVALSGPSRQFMPAHRDVVCAGGGCRYVPRRSPFLRTRR